MDGGKMVLPVVIAILSLGLTLSSWAIASHYSLTTPGDFAVGCLSRLSPPQSWQLGRQAIIVSVVDIGCWFAVLSGLCWLVQKFRS